MLQFKAFELSIAGTVWRFYLMMAVTIILGFLNQWILATILAFTIAVSFIVGISVNLVNPEKLAIGEKTGKLSSLDKTRMRKAA